MVEAMPSKLPKTKCLGFTKIGDVLNKENIHHSVFLIELGGGTSFEHLELISKTVLLPVLSNRMNQQRWGELVAGEVNDSFHSFLSSASILCGQVKGETRLPMPPIDGGDAAIATGQVPIALLESTILTWTKQIKGLLKQDPESHFKRGLHPTPNAEIEFWANKARSLNSIFEQLQGKQIRRVLRTLDQAKSTYCSSFAMLCKEVYNARLESNDNIRFLAMLEKWFDKLLNGDDFPKLDENFEPILHTILLIWKQSKYYNTPSRIVVLLKEICNALIEQTCRFVSGEEVFTLIDNDEANSALKNLQTAISICNTFKTYYFKYKARAESECSQNPWKIQNNAIFARLDAFIERCHDIKDLTQTIIQFSKLLKIEIGSTKGKALSESIHRIYHDFQKEVEKISGVDYDIMDIDAEGFDSCYLGFRQAVKEFERRLGAVICLGLDDCPTIYGKFQLIDSFDMKLLDRLIIKDEIESKHIDLLQAFAQDLKLVQQLFLHHQDNPPKDVTLNLPPVARALTWCRGLLRRVKVPMVKLDQLDKFILEREEAKEVLKIQAAIVQTLTAYEGRRIEEWGQHVDASSDAKLKLSLLQRSPETHELSTNFDKALICLLREVRYLLLLDVYVPPSALSIYESAEQFRRWTGNLDLIVNMNNSVLNQLLPVEKPLVAPYLAKFDNVIEQGIHELNWCSDGVDLFIKDSMEQVQNVHRILKTMKDNLSTIQMTLREWNKPMMERKTKPVEKEEFDRRFKAVKTTQHAAIKDSGKRIHSLLKETNKILRVSNASRDWRSYLDFVSGILIEGLSTCVITSLDFLYEQIDPVIIKSQSKLPLLEIKLELNNENRELDFSPLLGTNKKGKGIGSMIENMIGSFLQISTLFKRLDSEGTYMREMHADIMINNYHAMLSEGVIENEKKCMDLKEKFDEYSFLWKTDLGAHFDIFCENATTNTVHGTKLLDLKQFDDEIQRFHDIQAIIAKYESPMDVGWLRIDITPAKQQVSMLASKWIDKFTRHMLDTVTTTLTELHDFMGTVGVGLEREVSENDSSNSNLMDVMTVIRDVRRKMEYFSEISGPQNKCVQILRKYGVDVLNATVAAKNLQDYLEEFPLAWEAVVKKTFKKKEEILPMQMDSVDALKADLDEFYLSIREFRGDFRSNAPFKFDGECAEAYVRMDKYALQLDEFTARVEKFHELEDLFELQQTTYPEIGETLTEIKHLKNLWDFKAMVCEVYTSWRTSLWKDVNTDDLEDQNKKLRKQLKEQGNTFPIIKGWQVYRDIDNLMSVMSIALPLINDLHSEAMRPRHWSALARICNVKTVDPCDKNFMLDDMMSLNLHQHKEAIEDIVETAMKELKIERKLKEIEDVWSAMELDYVSHKDTEMFVPRPSEEVVESMEAHQMELQGIFGMGKFMDYFKDRVIHWQSLLRTVDDTLRIWMVVSKSWSGLESIFLASADIRSQLPEDTKRFEGIDSDFKELMKDAVTESNCVNVCSIDGRYESLKGMRERLELCQKSLNEYLDIKKKIFPRFYFVSSVALLDMLANGTNPPKIMPYLGDCYDALANLSFVQLESGETSLKTVNTMIAKDGERVGLDQDFTMEGEVENYLNRLTAAMQQSLRIILSDAIEKAASWEIETPRHEWLFNYPSQLCITGTQIYWSDETQLALEEYESGQEDAVKRYFQLCNNRLSALIQLVLGELASADRTKVISMITMDVHSRDVVDKLIEQKTEGPTAFAWQQQLKFDWEQQSFDVNVKICDFECKYFYEWVGNTGRLVITPLTDRCYITLTMGLKLFLGGAPAGPAGTGKVSDHFAHIELLILIDFNTNEYIELYLD
jgi:dynein heavy chain